VCAHDGLLLRTQVVRTKWQDSAIQTLAGISFHAAHRSLDMIVVQAHSSPLLIVGACVLAQVSGVRLVPLLIASRASALHPGAASGGELYIARD